MGFVCCAVAQETDYRLQMTDDSLRGRAAAGFEAALDRGGPPQSVTKPSVGAEIILFRPLKRAGMF